MDTLFSWWNLWLMRHLVLPELSLLQDRGTKEASADLLICEGAASPPRRSLHLVCRKSQGSSSRSLREVGDSWLSLVISCGESPHQRLAVALASAAAPDFATAFDQIVAGAAVSTSAAFGCLPATVADSAPESVATG